jgi:hypothetical protein
MRGAGCNPLIGALGGPNRGCGLLAGNHAIDAHHIGDPVIDGIIARIPLPHCQLADLGNLTGRLLCAAIELGRRRNTVEDLYQPANSPCGFYDRVRVGLARQDEGVENFRITRTIGCFIRIIDTQARK